jgi:hypothetical protein
MSASRCTLGGAAVLAALIAAPGAGAQSAPPTLAFDHPCYVEGQPMAISGAGYSPAGPVHLLFTRISGEFESLGVVSTAADPTGAINVTVQAPDLATDSTRDSDAVAANDEVKIVAGLGPDLAVAGGTFQVTALGVYVPQWDGRPPSRRKGVSVHAIGFTLDVGQTLYAHYLRRGRAVRSVPVGRLTGDCGDLDATMKQFPAGLKPRRYAIAFTARPAYSPSDYAARWHATKLKPRKRP